MSVIDRIEERKTSSPLRMTFINFMFYFLSNFLILPEGSTLFFLVHVMFGVGFPDAAHSILTAPPFFICKCEPELM